MTIASHLKALMTKIKNQIKFGYVSKVANDASDVQITQITYLGLTKNAATITPYGLYSNLSVGTKVVMFNILGQEENTIVIGFSQEDRFKNLLEGEVLIGNPKTFSYIKFDKDGNIEIESKEKVTVKSPSAIELDAPSVEIVNGNINITGGSGTMTVNGDIDMNINGNANINAAQVNLGSGGSRIARLGDTVQVDTGTGSGTITSAGANTST